MAKAYRTAMLRNTPLLEVVFDEPETVAWDDAGKFIRVIERQVHEAYRRIALTTSSPPWDDAVYSRSRMRARIAAPVERGSVIIPLTFELLPIHIQIFETAKAGNHTLAYIGDVIGLLADATDLLDFTLGVLFGRFGVLAGERKPSEEAKGGPLTLAEAEVSLKFIQQGVGVTKELMAAAKATDCEYVALRWRDVEIAVRRPSEGDESIVEPVKAPARRPGTRLIHRASDECITVRAEGRALPAILGQGGFHNSTYVLVWKSRTPLPLPMDQGFEVLGRFLPEAGVRGDFPPSWSAAEGIFLVEKARIADFE